MNSMIYSVMEEITKSMNNNPQRYRKNVSEWEKNKRQQVFSYIAHNKRQQKYIETGKFPLDTITANNRTENIKRLQGYLPIEGEVCPVCAGTGKCFGGDAPFCYVCEGEGALIKSDLPLGERKPFLNERMGILQY